MSARGYCDVITAIGNRLRDQGVVAQTGVTLVRAHRAEVRSVEWSRSGSAAANSLIVQRTLEDYLARLSTGDFTLLFVDGAWAQVRYLFDGDVLVKHNLLYFPCPTRLDVREWNGYPIEDAVRELIEDRGGVDLVTCLRFDFDATVEAEWHPKSHLTLNKNDCRLAVCRPLVPAHFFQLLITMFYRTGCDWAPVLSGLPTYNLAPTLREEEASIHHLRLWAGD